MIALVLTCDGCGTDWAPPSDRSADDLLDDAAGQQWVRVLAAVDGAPVTLDLCTDCRRQPLADLVGQFAGEPF